MGVNFRHGSHGVESDEASFGDLKIVKKYNGGRLIDCSGRKGE